MIAMIVVSDKMIEQFTPSDMRAASVEIARLIEERMMKDLMEVRNGSR